jgi:tRNA-(ms[2]io[6]A)-hydroxylase
MNDTFAELQDQDPPGNSARSERILERVLRSVPLRERTRPAWCDAAMADLGTLLEDHCQCELKAASNALAMIGRNPEKDVLVERMQRLAREELQHYGQIRALMAERGIPHQRPQASPYLAGLQAAKRGGAYALMDLLLVSAIVEARSCERFLAIADALLEAHPGPDGETLAQTYLDLSRSESGHAAVFLELAKAYYEPAEVEAELQRRLEVEAQVLASVPVSARMHGGHGPA